MITLHSIARALGGEVQGGQVVAPGPNHSPADRSLTVRLDPGAPDGFYVFSHAGDDPLACKDYVRERAGLASWKPGPKGDDPETIIRRMQAKAANGNQGAQKSPVTAVPRPRTVATYDYRTAEGEPFLRVVRTEPKGFYQHRWGGTGWQPGKPQGDPIPYRLPDMRAAVHDVIFVVEGEKDADRLADLGFIATTSPEGAGKWKPALNRWFEGRTVHILADNDDTGRKHAHDVARNLAPVAAKVRVVNLPGLPEKGDVSDWLDAGNDHGRLVDLCNAVPAWTEAAALTATREASGIDLTLFRDIEADARKSWLVDDMLGAGELTIFFGAPGCGKSVIVGDAACHVAAGREWFGRKVERAAVLYIAAERASLVKRRFAAWRKRHGIRDIPLPLSFWRAIKRLFPRGRRPRLERSSPFSQRIRPAPISATSRPGPARTT